MFCIVLETSRSFHGLPVANIVSLTQVEIEMEASSSGTQ